VKVEREKFEAERETAARFTNIVEGPEALPNASQERIGFKTMK
jgi:hypothetical protein